MTDKKALTRFFQAKHIPPSQWKTCDQTLQFNNVLTQLLGVESPALITIRNKTWRKSILKIEWFNATPVYHIETDIASKTPNRRKMNPIFCLPGNWMR